jgi:tRNA threonylcarbamoyladenosine biosynthesis protein TsaB
MILLAADTSGKEGSLALARAANSQLQILELVALNGGNFSAQLVPQMAALLAQHGFTHRDVSGFAVAVGPGSFTGLRVGLAAIKGLAEALSIPIAPVSRLEAVARASGRRGNVIAALDAGRRQAFVGDYDLNGDAATCIQEHLLSWEELAALLAGRPLATPDKNVADALRNLETQVQEIDNPRADAIARIGWKKLVAGETADVATLEANYIRRTDAEILVHGK